MITVPKDYGQAQAMTGEFESLPAGGYVCRIMGARETNSRMGKPMLEMQLDICEGENTGFFQKLYSADTRQDKRWGCIYRQMLTNESAGFLKGLVQDINQSNGMEWDFDENKLKGKYIGMLFQREEYEKSSGGTAFYTKPMAPRTIQKIRASEFTVPEDKLLSGKANKATNSSNGYDSLMAEIDEDLPF
jgi:hypothetical protein